MDVPVLVSYAPADSPWADWMARALTAAGHQVELQIANADFADRIAGSQSGHSPVLVLLSAEHRGRATDWAALAALQPPGRVIALCLDPAAPPPALRGPCCHSLHGLDEEETLDLLLALVGGPRRPG